MTNPDSAFSGRAPSGTSPPGDSHDANETLFERTLRRAIRRGRFLVELYQRTLQRVLQRGYRLQAQKARQLRAGLPPVVLVNDPDLRAHGEAVNALAAILVRLDDES